MRSCSRSICRASLLCITVLSPRPARVLAHDEIAIGRSESGRLQVHMDFASPVVLPSSPFSTISGWAFAEPGFASLAMDEPQEDLFQLDPSSQIGLFLVGADPGVRMYLGVDPLPVGGQYDFGPPFFDFHAVWNIYCANPGAERSLRMFVRDTSGRYTDSDEFTIMFAADTVPAACMPCDADCDAALTFADVPAFVDDLLGISTPCASCVADINDDGHVDGLDIQLFLDAVKAP